MFEWITFFAIFAMIGWGFSSFTSYRVNRLIVGKISPWGEKPFLSTNEHGITHRATPITLRSSLIVYLSDGRMAVLCGEARAYVYDLEPVKDVNV
jgi:hypothetical protein